MDKPYRYQCRVEWRDTDAAGIVHYSVFFNYMEEAEHALLRDAGVDVVNADDQGVYSFPRVSVKCDYKAPIRFSDVVDVDVTIARLGKASVTYQFHFSSNDRPIAEGEVTTVCCRLVEGKGLKSMAIPASIREKLTQLVP
ncbi:MAG: thioesterase family protein [Pirellulales bacterium]|nr:thioesterase family protein [Pirellulales bacterium]